MEKELYELSNCEFVKEIINNIRVKSVFNNGDELPFGYFCPNNTDIIWICSKDKVGLITSVFAKKKGLGIEDRMVEYVNMDKAKIIRDELIKNGWKCLSSPDVMVTYPGMDPIKISEERNGE